MCVTWLRLVIIGARWICGVRYRVQGMVQKWNEFVAA